MLSTTGPLFLNHRAMNREQTRHQRKLMCSQSSGSFTFRRHLTTSLLPQRSRWKQAIKSWAPPADALTHGLVLRSPLTSETSGSGWKPLQPDISSDSARIAIRVSRDVHCQEGVAGPRCLQICNSSKARMKR